MGHGLKILAIADLHDRWRQLELVKSLIKGSDLVPDLIAVCGDMHDGGSLDQTRRTAQALADLSRLEDGIEIPVLIVPGNTDPREHAEGVWEEMGFSILHSTSCTVKGFGFAGMGGIVPRDQRRIGDPRRYYFGDEEVYQLLSEAYRKISGLERKVVLTHQPPRGVQDTLYNGQDSGGRGLKRFLEDFRPELLICGHIHEARGEGRLGNTVVANAGELRQGSFAVIEIAEKTEVFWKSV
jgi:Icc-related predicted phosphoesterase